MIFNLSISILFSLFAEEIAANIKKDPIKRFLSSVLKTRFNLDEVRRSLLNVTPDVVENSVRRYLLCGLLSSHVNIHWFPHTHTETSIEKTTFDGHN